MLAFSLPVSSLTIRTIAWTQMASVQTASSKESKPQEPFTAVSIFRSGSSYWFTRYVSLMKSRTSAIHTSGRSVEKKKNGETQWNDRTQISPSDKLLSAFNKALWSLNGIFTVSFTVLLEIHLVNPRIYEHQYNLFINIFIWPWKQHKSQTFFI